MLKGSTVRGPLIIEAVDAEARGYRVSFDTQAGRDAAALRKRTEEVEQAAEDYLWRRRAHGVAVWTIARHLLAAGYYRNPVPPEAISVIWNRVVPGEGDSGADGSKSIEFFSEASKNCGAALTNGWGCSMISGR